MEGWAIWATQSSYGEDLGRRGNGEAEGPIQCISDVSHHAERQVSIASEKPGNPDC